MLIVCPSCASTYTIAAERLGTAGRRVRCAACRTQWFVDPADVLPSRPLRIEAAASGPDTRPADGDLMAARQDGDGPFGIAEAPAIAGFARSLHAPPLQERTEERAGERAVPPAPPPLRRAAGRARRAFRERLAGGLRKRAAVAAAMVLIAGIGLAVFKRNEVVKRLPATARLYAALGLPVNLRGLEFRAVKSELTAEDDNPILVVEGEIANVTRQAQHVPPIMVAIRNKGGQPLYTWTLDPPSRRLDPGATVPFRSRVAAPPAEAHDVFVRFGAASGRLAGLVETR